MRHKMRPEQGLYLVLYQGVIAAFWGILGHIWQELAAPLGWKITLTCPEGVLGQGGGTWGWL